MRTILSVAHILVLPLSVPFLRLSILVDEPERVDVSRDVAQHPVCRRCQRWTREVQGWTHVNAMLMRRSQEQPVRKPAAAGGKRIATVYGVSVCVNECGADRT